MSDPGLRELIADLRRRQVFKAAAVYGAVGYVLVQIADVFVPALLLPESGAMLLVACRSLAVYLRDWFDAASVDCC